MSEMESRKRSRGRISGSSHNSAGGGLGGPSSPARAGGVNDNAAVASSAAASGSATATAFPQQQAVGGASSAHYYQQQLAVAGYGGGHGQPYPNYYYSSPAATAYVPGLAAYAQQQQQHQQQQQWTATPLQAKPPPPPGPPPPPPEDESQNISSGGSARQPRSRLFKRSSSFPPKPSKPQQQKLQQNLSQSVQPAQQHKWVAALESSMNKKSLKLMPLDNKQPTATGTTIGDTNKSGGNDAATNINNNACPVPPLGKTKPSTFQSRDEALKVLKQRRRAKAAEAWKEKLVGGGSTDSKKDKGDDKEIVGLEGLEGRRVGDSSDSRKEKDDDKEIAGSKGLEERWTGGSADSRKNKGDGKEIAGPKGLEGRWMSGSADSIKDKGDDKEIVGSKGLEGRWTAMVNGHGGGGGKILGGADAKEEGNDAQTRKGKKSGNRKQQNGKGGTAADVDSDSSMSLSEQESDDRGAKDDAPSVKAAVVNAMASLTALQRRKKQQALDVGDGERKKQPAFETVREGGRKKISALENVGEDRCKTQPALETIRENGDGDELNNSPDYVHGDGRISPLTAAMNFAANASDLMDTEDDGEDGLESPTAVAAEADSRVESSTNKKGGKNADVLQGGRKEKNESDLIDTDDDENETAFAIDAAAAAAACKLRGGSSIKSSVVADSSNCDENKNKQESSEAAQGNRIAETRSAAKKKKKQKKNHNKNEDSKSNELEIMEPTELQRAESNPIVETPSTAIKKKKKQKKKKQQHQMSYDERSTSSSPITMSMTILERAHSEPPTAPSDDNKKEQKKEPKFPALPCKRLLASDDNRDGVWRILQSNLQNSKSSPIKSKRDHHNDSSSCKDGDTGSTRKNNHISQNNLAHTVSSYKDAGGNYVNSIVARSPLRRDANDAEDYIKDNDESKNNGSMEDGNTPLMDLWRKERRKKRKKKKPKTTRLFLSRRQQQQQVFSGDGKGSDDGDGDDADGGRRKLRKRHQLFRHQLLLPEEFYSLASSVAAADADMDVDNGDAEGDCGSEGGCPPRRQGRKRKRGDNAAKGAVKDSTVARREANAAGTLWDIWDNDDMSSDDEEEKAEIDVLGGDRDQQLEIQGRGLPYSDTLFWSQSVFVKRPIGSQRSAGGCTGNGAGKSEKTEVIHSLRERIARADALIQSKAPSYIEFQAKQWMEVSEIAKAAPAPATSTTSGTGTQKKDATAAAAATRASPATMGITAAQSNRNDDKNTKKLNATVVARPIPQAALPAPVPAALSQGTITSAIQNINSTTVTREPINYREQQTLFTLPPRSKSYASSNSAQEFLAALHSAAVEASAASIKKGMARIGNVDNITTITNTPSSASPPSATSIVIEFLSIIKESRTTPQQQHSPFHLMKKVWALIMSVVSRCDRGSLLGKELAQKFDAFLPEGYSMVSSNLLLLECSLAQRTKGEKDDGRTISCPVNHRVVEGCARTDYEFCGTPFR